MALRVASNEKLRRSYKGRQNRLCIPQQYGRYIKSYHPTLTKYKNLVILSLV